MTIGLTLDLNLLFLCDKHQFTCHDQMQVCEHINKVVENGWRKCLKMQITFILTNSKAHCSNVESFKRRIKYLFGST